MNPLANILVDNFGERFRIFNVNISNCNSMIISGGRVMKRIFFFILLSAEIVFAQSDYKTWVQEENIPLWTRQVFYNLELSDRYEFSFHINPCYLRGDFNGDQKHDIAILLKEIKTEKVGIGVFHAEKNQVQILGAGKSIGNGGDDFRWMDIWSVLSKRILPTNIWGDTSVILQGEALRVVKSESASGLIYWNGKNYSWVQLSD
jgi:hypothetical protein